MATRQSREFLADLAHFPEHLPPDLARFTTRPVYVETMEVAQEALRHSWCNIQVCIARARLQQRCVRLWSTLMFIDRLDSTAKQIVAEFLLDSTFAVEAPPCLGEPEPVETRLEAMALAEHYLGVQAGDVTQDVELLAAIRVDLLIVQRSTLHMRAIERETRAAARRCCLAGYHVLIQKGTDGTDPDAVPVLHQQFRFFTLEILLP